MPALEPHNIKYLVVHCSDTDEMDIEGIHNMHLGFGWEGVGYHKVICRDGTVRNGRPEFWQGAHVKGRNESSLGVCLIGRNSFNDAQFKSLITILSDWKSRYSSAQIVGHRDIQDTDKTCPNFDAGAWWDSLDAPIAAYASVTATVCPLYDDKDGIASGGRGTELLYGETVRILSHHQQDQLIKVKTILDSYEGWVPASDIGHSSDSPVMPSPAITWPSVTVTSAADVTSPALAQLMLGSQVVLADTADANNGLGTDKGWVEILLPSSHDGPRTGFIPAGALLAVSDWVGLAEQFEHAPYLWGGRSYSGIDCSALIQLCLHTAGLAIPRNSGAQFTFFQDAPHQHIEQDEPHQRGDVIFWPGHVALCLDDRHILHANAFHHKVAREDRALALPRLHKATNGSATTIRPAL
jgi:N-acetylmuramoyl-L-alanine amidase